MDTGTGFTRTILVIEDSPVVQGAMRMVLEWEGYRVSCAANGREALDLLQAGERPSLILLDLAMPVVDGREFRAAQRADPALAAIPVVVVSGNPVARSVEAEGHVQKPFEPEELLAAIRQAERPH
jgi:CheY-like chemotaxis protein